MKKSVLILFILIMFSILSSSFLTAEEINWENIKSNKIKLFYTGTATWEFLTSDDHGVGMIPVLKKKKSCIECHGSADGTYDIRVSEIVNGTLLMLDSKNRFEPNPIPNKNASIDASLQVGYDNENIYFRLQWKSSGKSWNTPDKEQPDRIAMQINSGQAEFAKFGCFIGCHSDQNSMPNSPSKDKVSKHPYYSNLKRDDVRLYTFYSRNEVWSSLKDSKALDELLKNNGLIDLWLATLNGKNVELKDQWILEDRQEDHKDIEGSGNWEDSNYTVIFKRKLNTGDKRDAALKVGSLFTVGIAIHDDKAKLRQHFVSFPVSIGLGIEGSITAKKIK